MAIPLRSARGNYEWWIDRLLRTMQKWRPLMLSLAIASTQVINVCLFYLWLLITRLGKVVYINIEFLGCYIEKR
jgi:hypothetical protein